MEDTGWKAELSLTFDNAGRKTVLRDQKHQGPLMVQRPFYPESDKTCHVYILHPPGGVVGGDLLQVSVKTKQQSHALITTPAAGKFYRSSGPCAKLSQNLSVEDGAVLEWLPQETIAYNQSNAQFVNRIELQGDARFIGWEVLCLGLSASHKPFERGTIRQSFEVIRDGKLLLVEKGRYNGGSPMLSAKWGMRNFPVTGTLICTNDDRQVLNDIREQTQYDTHDELFSATTLDGLIVCRYLGHDAYRAHRCFVKAWEVFRERVLQRRSCPPRIWKT